MDKKLIGSCAAGLLAAVHATPVWAQAPAPGRAPAADPAKAACEKEVTAQALAAGQRALDYTSRFGNPIVKSIIAETMSGAEDVPALKAYADAETAKVGDALIKRGDCGRDPASAVAAMTRMHEARDAIGPTGSVAQVQALSQRALAVSEVHVSVNEIGKCTELAHGVRQQAQDFFKPFKGPWTPTRLGTFIAMETFMGDDPKYLSEIAKTKKVSGAATLTDGQIDTWCTAQPQASMTTLLDYRKLLAATPAP